MLARLQRTPTAEVGRPAEAHAAVVVPTAVHMHDLGRRQAPTGRSPTAGAFAFACGCRISRGRWRDPADEDPGRDADRLGRTPNQCGGTARRWTIDNERPSSRDLCDSQRGGSSSLAPAASARSGRSAGDTVTPMGRRLATSRQQSSAAVGRRGAPALRVCNRHRCWAAAITPTASCRCAGCTTAPTTPGGSSCCRTSSRAGGPRSRTPSAPRADRRRSGGWRRGVAEQPTEDSPSGAGPLVRGGERSQPLDRANVTLRSAPFRGMKLLPVRLCLVPAVGSGDPGQGLVGRTQAGRPECAMGFEPGLFDRPPLRLAWIVLRARIGLCRCPPGSPAASSVVSVEVKMGLTSWFGRAIGLDVHRDFCVVAICDEGEVRPAGRVPDTREGLTLLAREPGAVGPGGVGGHGQLLGGGADPRAARGPRRGGQPG